MDERLRAVLAAQVSDEELAAVVAEARAAALAELRERLRQAMVDELLSRLAASSSATPPVEPPQTATPVPVVVEGVVEPAAPPPADDLAAELAALRAQLQENQSWLAGELGDLGAAPEPAPEPAPPAPPPAELPEQLLWVYAVRRAEAERAGPNLTRSTEQIAGLAPGAPVGALPCCDLEALVSLVPAAEFGEAAMEANLRDPDWLERAARAHQAALAALMARGTLVPLRFATLFASPERVAAMVAARADELRSALDQLDGHGEWGVKLLVDEAALAERLAAASPAVRELRDAIATKPAGAAYMLQKRLERVAAEEARRVSDECADTAHARLCAAAAAAAHGALREVAGETMLLNGAYLVADAAQAAFGAALDELRTAYEPLGFRLELSGPWPPYTFAAPQAVVSAE